MKNVLIYISYDMSEYINYFNMFIDDEIVTRALPIERSDELFDILDEMQISHMGMTLQIVADTNASDWDYKEALKKRGYSLSVITHTDSVHICEVLEETLGVKYCFSDASKETNKDGVKVQFIYPTNTDMVSDIGENDETQILLDKARIVMEKEEKDSEGMTELAKIIIEKYERMKKKHE